MLLASIDMCSKNGKDQCNCYSVIGYTWVS